MPGDKLLPGKKIILIDAIEANPNGVLAKAKVGHSHFVLLRKVTVDVIVAFWAIATIWATNNTLLRKPHVCLAVEAVLLALCHTDTLPCGSDSGQAQNEDRPVT